MLDYFRHSAYLLARIVYVSRFNPVPSLVRLLRARSRRPVQSLAPFERRFSSQFGEDGILETLFDRIGTTNRVVVEIGAGDGTENNSRALIERHGWRGILFDASGAGWERGIMQEFFTRENVNKIFARYGIPEEFDLLSIDIDGNDFWIWNALAERYRPRALVIEYNSSFGPFKEWIMPYNPDHRWDGTTFYGASLAALERLGRERGYTLVGCDSLGNNAFFVRADLAVGHFVGGTVEVLYRPARFGRQRTGHPQY